MANDPTLAGSLERIAKALQPLEQIAHCLGGGGTGAGGEGLSRLGRAGSPIVTRFAVGKGRVREDGRGLAVRYALYDADGSQVGEKLLNGEVDGATGVESLRTPESFHFELGAPGPFEVPQPTVRIQVRYDFGERGTITGVGKGISQLFDLANGRQVLADAAVATVVDGTGEFAGTRGIVNIVGFVETGEGQDLPFGLAGAAVDQTTVETFRLIPGKRLAGR